MFACEKRLPYSSAKRTHFWVKDWASRALVE